MAGQVSADTIVGIPYCRSVQKKYPHFGSMESPITPPHLEPKRAATHANAHYRRSPPDIEWRIIGNEDLREALVRPLFLARRVLEQERRQRGRKVYSLHAPEVECIGKDKAHRPYEFGVKVSVATTVKHPAGVSRGSSFPFRLCGFILR
jgi:hypothetical protein